MAWVTKYRCEFYDIKGLAWKWDFELDGYTTPVYNMQAAGDPATYEPLADTDDLYENPVRGIRAELRVISESLFQYSEFFTVTDLQMRCSIYYGSTLYFRGYVLPFSYSEPYSDYPYQTSIVVSCGLAALKAIKYDNAGTPYSGHKLESQILLDILAKIGFTTFTEIVNIYEDRMDDGDGDSPMDQTYADSSLFGDMFCYEVLEWLLKKWNALIRQRAGVFHIYHPTEMISTAYARTFTGASTKTDSTLSLVAPLIRSTSPDGDLRDHNGGTMMLIPPVKKLILNHDYGWRESWLDNWNFRPDSFDGTDIDYWTRAGGITINHMNEEVGGEDGIYLKDFANPATKYIYQILPDVGRYSAGDDFIISFMYKWNVFDIPAAVFISISVGGLWYADGIHQKDHNDTDFTWVSSANEILISTHSGIQDGWSEWLEFRHRLIGLPVAGDIEVRIYASGTDHNYWAIKDFRLYCTTITISRLSGKLIQSEGERSGRIRMSNLVRPDKIPDKIIRSERNVVLKQYSVTNALNGIESELDYNLGDVVDSDLDNVLGQFKGALGINVPDSLESVVARFIDQHWADFQAIGILLSQKAAPDDDTLLLTAETAGVDFDDDPTITNTAGDLDGVVSNVTPNSAGTKQVDRIVFSGSSGSIDITVDTVTETMSYVDNMPDTIDAFIATFETSFNTVNCTLSRGSTPVRLILTEIDPLGGFTTSVSNESGLTGVVTTDTAASAPVARVDQIVLSGSSGTADIEAFNDSSSANEEASFTTELAPTASWHTKGNAEGDPLLEITGGELGYQMSRPRQILSLPIHDLDVNDTDPHVDVIGCFSDDLNEAYSGSPRKFAFNRGVFDMKNRHWDIDMIEVVFPEPT
jgi:hypothetical protein